MIYYFSGILFLPKNLHFCCVILTRKNNFTVFHYLIFIIFYILFEIDVYKRQVLRTGDPGWVARLVWRLGGSARVVEPADLARSVRDGAREALAAYDALGQQA